MSDLTFRKGTRYGCGEELSSRYNLLVKSSGSIFASCCAIKTQRMDQKNHAPPLPNPKKLKCRNQPEGVTE